jgi:hypothetical protein
VGEAGGVEMQQEELVGQEEELVRPAVGEQQGLVEVDDADDFEDKEATDALEIDKYRFRLRGIRARQLAGRMTKITQYRVVWGEHLNRCDSWVNEDDVRMLMLPPPCERSPEDLALQVETEVVRVHQMRDGRLHKGRKGFVLNGFYQFRFHYYEIPNTLFGILYLEYSIWNTLFGLLVIWNTLIPY